MLTATPWKENVSSCACCGKRSMTFWGDVSDAERARAVYYVHYTMGSADHPPFIDLIVGPWGEEAKPDERVLVTMAYRPGPGGGLMVVDAMGRPVDTREMCGRALARTDVVGTPLAAEVFALVDAVFLHDPRMQDVVNLA